MNKLIVLINLRKRLQTKLTMISADRGTLDLIEEIHRITDDLLAKSVRED